MPLARLTCLYVNAHLPRDDKGRLKVPAAEPEQFMPFERPRKIGATKHGSAALLANFRNAAAMGQRHGK